MKKELVRVGPLKVGIILGVLQGLMGLIIVTPIFLLFSLSGAKTGGGTPFPAIMGAGFAFIIPIFYAILGFIVGVISAALYNLIAGWTGGIEVEVRDAAPM